MVVVAGMGVAARAVVGVSARAAGRGHDEILGLRAGGVVRARVRVGLLGERIIHDRVRDPNWRRICTLQHRIGSRVELVLGP